MFKKKVKLEIPPQTRIEIIHNNFFNYLKENNISQKKYSEDNNVPESTISKWKSCTSNMNEEHIIQAAKYFNISVNRLYYTKQELKEINVLEVNDYNPIMAQQQIVNESIEYKVENTKAYIFISFLFAILLISFVSYWANEYENFLYLLLLFIMPIISKILFRTTMIEQNTFIINYLDQIYYKTNVKKNKYFLISLIFNFIQLLIVLGLVIYTIYWIVDCGYNALFQTIILCCVISIVLIISCLLHLRNNMKEKIYDDEIADYNYSLASFIMILVLTMSTVPFFVYIVSLPWLLSILVFILALSFANVMFVVKKYSMYDLIIYDHKEGIERKLYNK